jgi:hypothetical protein
MSNSKKTPRSLLNILQKLNPDATPAQIKELLSDEFQKDPERLGPLMLKDLWADFERETGYRGGPQSAPEQFIA